MNGIGNARRFGVVGERVRGQDEKRRGRGRGDGWCAPGRPDRIEIAGERENESPRE